jgi:tetratricopeptide (TPR) repeat protein
LDSSLFDKIMVSARIGAERISDPTIRAIHLSKLAAKCFRSEKESLGNDLLRDALSMVELMDVTFLRATVFFEFALSSLLRRDRSSTMVYLNQMLITVATIEEPPLKAFNLCRTVFIFRHLQKFDESKEVALSLEKLAAREQHRPFYCVCICQAAVAWALQNQINRAQALLGRLDDDEVRINGALAILLGLSEVGEVEQFRVMAQEVSVERVVARCRLANLFLDLHEIDETKRILSDVCERTFSYPEPARLEALSEVALLYARLGEPKESVQLLRHIENVANGLEANLRGQVFSNAAIAYARLDNFEESLRCLEQVNGLEFKQKTLERIVWESATGCRTGCLKSLLAAETSIESRMVLYLIFAANYRDTDPSITSNLINGLNFLVEVR